MYRSKFIQLYQTLSPAEIRLLRKWVSSPFHNQHSDCQRLFEFLFTRRSISAVTTQKKRAFAWLFPEQDYDDLRMRHLMSTGLKTLEEFVGYNQAVQEKLSNDFFLAQAYRQRQQPKQAQKKLQEAQKKLLQQTERSDGFYLQQYQIESERFRQIGTQQRTGSNNLQELTTNLSHFYLINILKYACIRLSHQSLRQTDYQIPMLGSILQEIENGNYPTVPVIELYRYAYLALTKHDEEHYFGKLKQLILQHRELLSVAEIKEIYLLAINYCIRWVNRGNQQYIQEALDLYEDGLEHEVLFNEGILSRFAYKNVVALALGLQKYEWVRQFIKQYTPRLEPRYRESYAHYNTAKLHFKEGNYSQAMRLLAQIEYDDLFLNIDAKVMLLRMYYEEGEYDALESLLHSFNVFLQRKKEIMSYHRENYQNAIQLTKRLCHLRSGDQQGQQNLLDAINNTQPLTERAWLLEQLEKKG